MTDRAESFHGTVADLGTGDQIDSRASPSRRTSRKGKTSLSTSGANTTLNVTDGVPTVSSLQLLGAFIIASEFTATSDGYSGTPITFIWNPIRAATAKVTAVPMRSQRRRTS